MCVLFTYMRLCFIKHAQGIKTLSKKDYSLIIRGIIMWLGITFKMELYFRLTRTLLAPLGSKITDLSIASTTLALTYTHMNIHSAVRTQQYS